MKVIIEVTYARDTEVEVPEAIVLVKNPDKVVEDSLGRCIIPGDWVVTEEFENWVCERADELTDSNQPLRWTSTACTTEDGYELVNVA